MSRFTWAGIISWIASLVLYVNQVVSRVIEKGTYTSAFSKTSVWDNLSLSTFFGPQRFAWADEISWTYLEKTVNYIIHAQIYVLIFFIGILFFIIGMFRTD